MTRLLFADNDADICDLIARSFRLRGWQVTTASSGVEALTLLDTQPFDLAVLDHWMPPGSGLEVAAERRRLGDSLPIVLWTAWTASLDEQETRRLGVHVLDKADVERLTSLVLQLVGAG